MAQRPPDAALSPPSPHRNEILLAGRVAEPARTVTLPSGDELVCWRLVVERPVGGRGPKVDSLDCVSDRAAVRRQALRWSGGELVEVQGALRRRFFRSTAGGVTSRHEVQAATVRRVAR